MAIYKYTISVYSTSDQAGNMLIGSLNRGDEYATLDDIEDWGEEGLPPEVVVRNGRIIHTDYNGDE